MNTKQLTYPSIKIQEQYWIDKEAQSNNATPETREDENTLRWIATTLVNDEASCNQDLQEHFEANDISTKAARFYISQRNEALKHGLTFKLKPFACLTANEATTVDPKPKPILEALLNAPESFEDIGGNELPDRIEANKDFYEVNRNDFDRGDLRDEGRNPDGSGLSYGERQ